MHDFDHSYSPNGKSVKFLETGYGLSTFAECQKCLRSTEGFKTPIGAIIAWNDGEMYNTKEWKEKLEREYTGKIFSDEEIKNFIENNLTDAELEHIGIYFTNGDYMRAGYDSEYKEYSTFFTDKEWIVDTDIHKFINKFLGFLKEGSLKIKEIEVQKRL